MTGSTRARPPRRLRDLLLALAVHLVALPFWFVQAFLWDFPRQTPQAAARTKAFIMAYGGTVMVVYLTLLVALVVWWRQGRQRVYLSPLVAWGLAWCPCLLVFLMVPPLRRALVPPRPRLDARQPN